MKEKKRSEEFTYFLPGIYQHYKGGYYRALFNARLSEHQSEEVIVYVSASIPSSGPIGQVWVRPYRRPLLEGDNCWLDMVVWPDGVTRPRFMRVDDRDDLD